MKHGTTTVNLGLMTFGAIQIFLLTLIPHFVERTGLRFSEIVFCFSLGTLCFLPGSLFWSKYVSRAFGVNVLILSLTTFVLAVQYHFALSSLALLLGGRLLYGFGASGIPVTSQLVRLQRTEPKLPGLFRHSQFLNVGRLLGPVLGLLPLAPSTTLFLLAAWLFVLFLAHETQSSTAFRFDHPAPPLARPDLNLLPVLGMIFILTLTVTLVQTGLPAQLMLKFRLPPSEAAVLLSQLLLLGSVGMLAGQEFGKRLRDHLWEKTFFAGFSLFLVGLFALLMAVTRGHFMTGIFSLGIGVSLLHPAIVMALETVASETGRAQRLGFLNAVSTLGSALGGLSIAAAAGSFSTLFISVSLVLLFLCFTVMKKTSELPCRP